MTDIAPDLPPLDLSSFDLEGTLMERMGMEILSATAQECIATMPVAGNTQPFGLLHGGATAALAETVGSIAALIHAGPNASAAGLELSITHHRSARSGIVTGRAVAQHLGRSTATYLVDVTDELDRRISSARLTCLLLRSAPSSPSPS